MKAFRRSEGSGYLKKLAADPSSSVILPISREKGLFNLPNVIYSLVVAYNRKRGRVGCDINGQDCCLNQRKGSMESMR